MLGWRLFEQLFAGVPAALGSSILINQIPYTVVGVMAPNHVGISASSPIDLYLPITRIGDVSTHYRLDDPHNWWIQLVGRVAPGVSDAGVRSAVNVVLQRIVAAYPSGKGEHAEMRPLIIDGRTGLAFLNRRTREFLGVLFGMVGLVLLIACANLANLLTARGNARSRELAIRRSLGAGYFRLARYLLTESALLAVLGCAAGILLARTGTAILANMAFPDPETAAPIRPDLTVASFAVLLSLCTVLLFGLVPALRAARVEPALGLKQSGTGAGGVHRRLARALILVQVALAVVLAAGAGLFARTLVNLGRVEIGFRPENLLVFHVRPGDSGYKDARLIDVYRRIQAKLAALPGVRAVAPTQMPQLTGWMSNNSIDVPGYRPKPGEFMSAYRHVVGERFLTMLGTPILLGRDFDASDDGNAPPVAIINSTLAKKYFEGNPLGREIYFGASAGKGKPLRIVGVAADAKYDSLRTDIPATIYRPWPQSCGGGMHFMLRTAVEPLALVGAVRKAVASIDPMLPVSEMRTQHQIIERATVRERSFVTLGGTFSVIALLLAGIGIYGVLAYTVARRTGEFGVRMALGATPAQIRWLSVRGMLTLVACAVAIGIPAALAASRLVRNMLYGVEPADPVSLAVAAVAITAAALIAAWVPGMRAARSAPAAALRFE